MKPATRRILLVDDEPSIIKMIGKRLEMAGFEVSFAMDGQTALTKVRQEAPTLIILDMMLPKLSGLDVCAALKHDPQTRHIPVLVFTGKGQLVDEQLCREYGADAYLNKSFRGDEIVQHVEALLAQATNLARDRQAPPSKGTPPARSGPERSADA